jgi:hypothetical protein
MQSAERQSASRQMPVDRLETEGQHQSPAAGRAFEAPDPLAKLLGTGTGHAATFTLAPALSHDLQKQRDKFALAMCVGLGKDRFQLIARRLP